MGVSNPFYQKLAQGQNGCPAGSEIQSVDECKMALRLLGYATDPSWVSVFDGLPRHCSLREKTTSNDKERMHFNSAPSGTGRQDLAPICKGTLKHRTSKPKLRAQTTQTSTQLSPGEGPPEVSKTNYKELLGSEGFSFIYLVDGKLATNERQMLAALRDRFKSQLDDQGTIIHWMWMDMRIERRMSSLFEPPLLPSAVVLNPHKKPKARFALLKQREDADDEDAQAKPA